MIDISEVLKPGVCLKKKGSVRTYRIIENVSGPWVLTRLPNGVPEQLPLEGLFDIWELGIDSKLEAAALTKGVVEESGLLLKLCIELLDTAFDCAYAQDDIFKKQSFLERTEEHRKALDAIRDSWTAD